MNIRSFQGHCLPARKTPPGSALSILKFAGIHYGSVEAVPIKNSQVVFD